MAAFAVHQSVEKALKAAIVDLRRQIPPRTHDLVELGRHLAVPEGVSAALRRLNPHYAVSRDPDAANGVPAEQYDRELAEELLALGERVRAWVRSELTTRP